MTSCVVWPFPCFRKPPREPPDTATRLRSPSFVAAAPPAASYVVGDESAANIDAALERRESGAFPFDIVIPTHQSWCSEILRTTPRSGSASPTLLQDPGDTSSSSRSRLGSSDLELLPKPTNNDDEKDYSRYWLDIVKRLATFQLNGAAEMCAARRSPLREEDQEEVLQQITLNLEPAYRSIIQSMSSWVRKLCKQRRASMSLRTEISAAATVAATAATPPSPHKDSPKSRAEMMYKKGMLSARDELRVFVGEAPESGAPLLRVVLLYCTEASAVAAGPESLLRGILIVDFSITSTHQRLNDIYTHWLCRYMAENFVPPLDFLRLSSSLAEANPTLTADLLRSGVFTAIKGRLIRTAVSPRLVRTPTLEEIKAEKARMHSAAMQNFTTPGPNPEPEPGSGMNLPDAVFAAAE